MQIMKFSNLEEFFIEELNNGLNLNLIDLIFGKYFIYALSPQNILHPCVIYKNILSMQEYEKNAKPCIHFCNCNALWEIQDRKDALKAKIFVNNEFDFKIRVESIDIKTFYRMELPFCIECINIYNKLFSYKLNSYELDCNFARNLFLDSKLLKIEKIALEDSILLNFSYMNLCIQKDYFYLQYREKENYV